MNYYRQVNGQYNPFAPFLPTQTKIFRTASEPKLSHTPSRKLRQIDSLDKFQKQMQQKLIINPEKKLPSLSNHQGKRQFTQPSMAPYENQILSKKLITESGDPYTNNNIRTPFRPDVSGFQKKRSAFNPTFVSNIVLL